MPEILKGTLGDIGALAGIAALIGVAILSALYWSLRRDVQALLDWAEAITAWADEDQARSNSHLPEAHEELRR